MSKEKSIKIIPLGGLGAIGKNMTLFEYGDDIIIVDCGIKFPNELTPGIDFIIPDLSYVKKNKKRIRGIVITHGHEDHIGAVPFLLKEVNVPVYATKLTLGLIKNRLEERFSGLNQSFVEIKSRDTIEIGGFTIEFIQVNHSISDGVGLAITTEIGTVVYTGDFKIDFSPVDGEVTDIYRFARYGEEGVLLLMSDSTNAEREGFTRSESMLEEKLVNIFSNSKGRIIVASFASNINRIQQILDISRRFNRKVVISGLTMQKNVEMATELGYLTYRKDLIVDIPKANLLPNKKLVVIGTGSQGEPMSALSRMANGTHRHFAIEKGDTVIITASVIPGNERLVTNVVNTLMSLGAEVYSDQDDKIHVSGHGSAKELKLMITITRPKFFIPIHGEYKHLKAHADIAESLNIKPSRILIAAEGDILELNKKSLKRVGGIELSQIYVDGTETGDIESSVIKDRHTMSSDGVVLVTIVISEGMLMRQPDIFSRGFVGSHDTIIRNIKRDVGERVTKMLADNSSPEKIMNDTARGIKNLISRQLKRYPLVDVQVIEV